MKITKKSVDPARIATRLPTAETHPKNLHRIRSNKQAILCKIITMLKPYECTQCGSTDFIDVNLKRVKCSYCGSLFQLLTGDPSVVINPGAKVVFGRNANVEIRGDMEIQSGADVDIQGKVTVLKGRKQQEFSLKLIQSGSTSENKK